MSSPSKQNSKQVKKNLFIISPIGKEDSETRIFFDKVRRNIIDPIAVELGYETERSDDIQKPGTITKQIIEALRTSDLVVADLSRKNPNVFYELAVRHAVGKPVILLSAVGDTIPFDLSAQRVIFYDFDPDHVREAKEDLTEQIQQVESETFVVDSPIDRSLIISIPDDQISEPTEETQVLAILRKQSEDIGRILGSIDESTRVSITAPPLHLPLREFFSSDRRGKTITQQIYQALLELEPIDLETLGKYIGVPPKLIRTSLLSLIAADAVEYNVGQKTYAIKPKSEA